MKRYILLLPIILCWIGLFAQENGWNIPEEQTDKTAPMLFTPEMKTSGETIYAKNCVSCHGNPTQDNMNKYLKPMPSDLGSDKVAVQTDGALHFKLVTGKGTMPSFKNVLSNNDIWSVISYIRGFHADYIQPEPSVISAFAGKALTLSLEFIADENKFKVLALGKENEKDVPAEGVEVSLFTKRYFGLLKLADNKTTNNKGLAYFDAPDKLPGDTIGNLTIIAKVVDTEQYGEAKVTEIFSAGVENNKPSLTANRAMWNVNKKAPWWITLAYPLAVLSVLATIGYILLLLKKIFILGKEESETLIK